MRFFLSTTLGGTYQLEYMGAQIELGSFATSYIPTTASTVTRGEDVASITGVNFSQWYNQSEGTFYVIPNSTAATARAFTVSDNTIAEQIAIGQDVCRVRTGNTDVASFFATQNITVPYTIAYASNNHAGARAGTLQTDTVGGVPVVSRMYIGGNATGTAILNGTISKIAYFNKRLSDNLLRALTTL
jgi:hypothetical protein